MSIEERISYSNIKEKNIFDTRFTGSGKTTSAIEYIHEVVKQDRPVIVLMQSYERLENNYYLQFDDSLKARTIIFKGKTQEGSCKFSSQYKALWNDGKIPKNECETCTDKDQCNYQKQFRLLKEYTASKKGFCILTTDKNLNKILSETGILNPTIIIDDISLSTVVMPEIIEGKAHFHTLLEYNTRNGIRCSILNGLLTRLIEYKEGSGEEIQQFILSNIGRLQSELDQFKITASGGSGLPDPPSYLFINQLAQWVKNQYPLHFYSEYKKLKIVADTGSKYSSNRFFYLNATPSLKDEYCIKHLGNYKHLHAIVEESKKYVIFQIIDSACAQQSVLQSTKLHDDFHVLTDIINKPLSFINQKFLLFTFDKLFKKWVTDGVLSGLDYTPEIFFGSGTRGTNDYKDYPISIILGTPRYPPVYYLHPAFETVWRPKEEIEKQRIERPLDPLYYVNTDISEKESQINLLQMIGRNLRDSSNDPNSVKMVIVFTKTDISKECEKQNGAKVITIPIRNEVGVKKGKKKGKTPNLDAVKYVTQKALRPKIIIKMEEIIDKRLKEYPEKPLLLDQLAKEFELNIGIYTSENLKKIIKMLYLTEVVDIPINGKTIKTAIIKQKKVK